MSAMNTTPTIDVFWSKVAKREASDCWEWIGTRDEGGYGIFYVGKKKNRAHRWLLGHLRGEALIGAQSGVEDACHRCDNPPCCNPAHLYVGTRKRNIADALERSRLWQQKVTHCPKGHAYEGANLYTKPSGARACRTCRAEADRLAKERKKQRSLCRKGHSLTGNNVLLCRNGTRKCRICDQARNDKRKRDHQGDLR